MKILISKYKDNFEAIRLDNFETFEELLSLVKKNINYYFFYNSETYISAKELLEELESDKDYFIIVKYLLSSDKKDLSLLNDMFDEGI